ncbi:hypothetical protein ASE17_10895 [Phenylobacterium sp. Root77]|uniref:DUF2157 domain-containing protein n=1 Tax=unclassified Phenylobacterium TaxID=2640670 RepID=UPI0006F31E5A|nr:MULTISPECIES: DUF2157 domain-containing protein [unclassified Phenylobacterium]KQW73417.1 hypothetical protein ASC73_03465 [Phenylobacterium sp. Root1277]KQW92636.1 hypothetical protein ASC79_14175 [Phenylobacterium sp. Root1290]KRC40863.1 hypothetical protein ASE17_10895 [Phenylobacterium sp. Root77]
MAGYKARLTKDVDEWVAAGLVPAENRQAILDCVSEERRVDASAALAVIGALLLGAAAIAFVAANWGAIPRLPRFGLIVGLFLAVAGGGAWAARAQRPLLSNTLLAVAALVYAAAIGLTGQIFDIAGDPQRALRSAGLAAALLTLAGRSSAAGVVALALLGFGEFAGRFDGGESRWLIFAAPVGMALAWLWHSKPLAHASALALVVGLVALISMYERWGATSLLISAAVLALLAGAARQLSDRRTAVIFFLWFVWGAMVFYGVAGFDEFKGGYLIAHRAAWLLIAGGVIALGMHDRQGMVTAAGVVSMIAAVCAILFDLGLGLMTAAGLFAACALIALVAGGLTRRRAKA